MMWMLLLMAGIIPDGSAYARIYVLPQTERIATWEPGDKSVQFYDLRGKKVGALAIDGELHIINSALDMIFLTVVRKNGRYDLMITDKRLRAPRTLHNASFSYPNVLAGRIYATDYHSIAQRCMNFPYLATLFEPGKLRFGNDCFFKLPKELADQGRYPMRFWILEYGGTRLAFMQGSFTIYQLDAEYLGRERIDSETQPTTFRTTYPIGVPGNAALRGKFRLARVVPCEEAEALRQQWFRDRELLSEVWQDGGKILIAYGSIAKGTTIGYLDETFQYHTLATEDGTAIAGFKDTVWLVNRTKTKTALKRVRLTLPWETVDGRQP